MVKNLREATGAGVMDVKRALDEASGDMEAATKILREKGLAAAAKRSGRETNQGVIESYLHAGGRIGALVEINCETDFVAATDEFRGLARDIAMQIAAMNPTFLSTEERAAATDPGEGKDDELVLLSQAYIKDGSKTINDLVKDAVARTGENIRVSRFARFELGN